MTTTNRRNFIIASVLSVAVLVGGSSTVLSALAQDERIGPGKRPPAGEPPWMSQLTDEQKTEIQQLIESLRASGATREEIRDAVNAKLQEWGIEIPEPPPGSHQPAGDPPWMGRLTDEQRTEITTLTQSMKDSGATQEEIMDAVNMKLQGWGIEIPTPSEHPKNSAREPPWMSQLTDEQKTEIQQLIESLRASGATREEIRDAVNAKLQEWGIEIPEMPTPPSISGE